jgi:hypothetical protein
MNLHDLRPAHKYSDVPKTNYVGDDGVCSPCCEMKATKLLSRDNFENADEVGEVGDMIHSDMAGKLPVSCPDRHQYITADEVGEVGDIIHSDMAGKLPVSFPDRCQYIIAFTDDNSRHISVAFMQRKSQLPQAFTTYRRDLQVLAKRKLEMGEIHTSNSDDFKIEEADIRTVRVHSDGGKEYEKLERLDDHLAPYSAPYTLKNNPISERGNRTLFDAARTLLIEADLPACFWPFAIKHVVYVRHATTGDSPHNMVTGEKPSLQNLKVFGCRAYVLILPTPSKFERHAEPGILLERLLYGVYKVLAPSTDGGESKIITSRYVILDEEELPGLKDMADTMNGDGVIQAMRASQSKAQNPVMTVSTPPESRNI